MFRRPPDRKPLYTSTSAALCTIWKGYVELTISRRRPTPLAARVKSRALPAGGRRITAAARHDVQAIGRPWCGTPSPCTRSPSCGAASWRRAAWHLLLQIGREPNCGDVIAHAAACTLCLATCCAAGNKKLCAISRSAQQAGFACILYVVSTMLSQCAIRQ